MRNKYVCPKYSDELKRHIAFKDYLRTNKEDRDWYGEVKLLAAKYYPEDINSYMIAKNLVLQKYLRNADFSRINKRLAINVFIQFSSCHSQII
ncbi:MAG: hypothetical protein EWM50_07120 [Gottschalkiaceae bacterium]|nr:MAG: hypothetical protein EWM50_07120 [Gottschalkiaceae bacterium]